MIIAGILLVSVAFIVVVSMIEKDDKDADDQRTAISEATADAIYVGEIAYVPNPNIETILVLGTDTSEARAESGKQYTQADFSALVVLDKVKRSFKIIHINRDTMTEFNILDDSGKKTGTRVAQLTLAYSYGATDTDRCKNSAAAVSNLFYGIRVNHYIAVTLDAVPVLNDSVGGVTLELLVDMTDYNPEFEKGKTVTLKGKDALRYVQARGSLEDSTNLSRMERQKQYVNALFDTYNRVADEVDLQATLKKILNYTTSSCSIDQLSRLIDLMRLFKYEGIVVLEGEAKDGAEFVEYYLDEVALQKLVIDMFYRPAKTE